MSETEQEEMNEQVDHLHEQLCQSHEELLRDCGECISELSTRDKGGKHSPTDFHLPMAEGCSVGANSLTLLSCSHVIASGLLQQPQARDQRSPRHTWNEVTPDQRVLVSLSLTALAGIILRP